MVIMAKYLLDTNICISLIKNRYGIRNKVERIVKHFERIPGIKIEDWCDDNNIPILLNEPDVKYNTKEFEE